MNVKLSTLRCMPFCLILMGLYCLLVLTIRNVKRDFLNMCIVDFYFMPGSVFTWKV